jgi:predicted CXXCH cytochrome family protein
MLLRVVIFLSFSFSQSCFAQSSYIGTDACSACHLPQVIQWYDSAHYKSMQEANDDTIVGEFNDNVLTQGNSSTRFFRLDNQYFIEVTGPDEQVQRHRIAYTIGFNPLQQYLIKTKTGRLQVLEFAWDNRSAEMGGKRWFYHKVNASKGAHFMNSNWNAHCADCHATGVEKNYNAKLDRYDTQWQSIHVSCEACHGPGQAHVQWAKEQSNVSSVSSSDTEQGSNYIISGKNNEQSCARCHSHRIQYKELVASESYLNHSQPELLTSTNYYLDGQIKKENFVWQSYQLSSKFAQQVSCVACHDPHTSELKLPGNRICLSCHENQQYQTVTHHQHAASTGVGCIDCHMRSIPSMTIGQHHDHSFRVPELISLTAEPLPNACLDCHQDKDTAWLKQQLKTKPSPRHSFTQLAVLSEAQQLALTTANEQVIKALETDSLPTIAKASLISRLAVEENATLDSKSLAVIKYYLQAKDLLLRLAALQALEHSDIDFEWQAELIFPLLDDTNQIVRIQVARMLVGLDESVLESEEQQLLNESRQALFKSLEHNLDHPRAHIILANYYLENEEFLKAEQQLRQGIQLHPDDAAIRLAMAEFYTTLDRDADAIQTLKQALDVIPEMKSADIYYQLGLAQVRQQDFSNAIVSLASASALSTDMADYGYVYAMALNSDMKHEQAYAELQKMHQRHPYNIKLLKGLIQLAQTLKKYPEALDYAEKIVLIDPADQSMTQLINQLRVKAKNQTG